MPAASGESSASAGCGLRGPPVIVDRSFRRGRTHDLSRMSRADLLKAFFLDSTVLTYVVMAAVGGGLAVRWAGTVWPPLVAVALTALLYPLAEYGLHRCVLHGRFLYKARLTASLWKRIHFDHHRDPYDLRGLFGALYERTTGVPPSATVFNLGYTAIEAKRYPWVAELSAGARRDGDPRRVGTE